MVTESTVTRVICSQAPTSNGHYEQAILHGNILYVSGQLGVAKGAAAPESISVGDQMTYALSNIEAIARTVGSSRSDVVKATVYVTDIVHWDEANRAYAAFFGAHKPARSVVPCGNLHLGSKVEIEVIVAVK